MAYRKDDALGLYVQRQLMDQRKRIYDAPLPPLNGLTLLPPRGDVALGATSYNRRVLRHFGKSQWIGASGDDLPLANVGVIEDVYNVAMHGAAYRYSLKEQRAAQFAGESLDDKRAMAARRAILEFNNAVAIFGSVAKRITGLLSIPYIPRVAVPASIFALGSDTDAIIAVFTALKRTVERNTNEAESPDTFAVASAIYDFLADTRGNNFNDRTLLEMIKASTQMELVKMRELSGAGPSGEDMILALSTGEDKVEHNLPDPLTVLEPQPRNLVTVVNMVSETGGVVSTFPLAHAFAEVA